MPSCNFFYLMPSWVNSTVIRELSTTFFSDSFYLGARGLYLRGGGGYIRVLLSGRLVSWGLISDGLTYPGAYNRELMSGAYFRGISIRELITGGLCPGLISGGFLCRGAYTPH